MLPEAFFMKAVFCSLGIERGELERWDGHVNFETTFRK
jgi:hypothetical protein